jgi:hypothetical protein
MSDSLEGNIQFIVRAPRVQVVGAVRQGSEMALYFLSSGLRRTLSTVDEDRVKTWATPKLELTKECERELAAWLIEFPWADPEGPDPQAIDRHGPGYLYLQGFLLIGVSYPFSLQILSEGRDAHALRQRLLA